MRFFWRGVQTLLVVAGLCLLGTAGINAQGGGRGDQNFKQVQLTPKLVEGFISAQKDMADFAQKNQPSQGDKPDPKIQAQLDELAKKNGFADFAEFDDVAFNISMVMGGLDPQSGKFTDPLTAIKQEIDSVKGDKSIPEKEKKQMLEELNEALKNTPPLQFPENVEIVRKYRDEIDKVLQ